MVGESLDKRTNSSISNWISHGCGVPTIDLFGRSHEGMKMSERRKLSPEEDQRIVGISAMLTLPILLGGAFYVVIYLHAITDLLDISQTIVYLLLLVAPISMGFCFAICEVLYSQRMKSSFGFHFKRFLFRMLVIASYFTFIAGLWFVFVPFISWRYSVLFSLILASFALAAVSRVPKIRNLLERFGRG